MQVVVADMPPCGRLEPLLSQRRAVEGDDIAQAVVGNGHVAAELGDRRLFSAALVDEHVHALGNGMAEEPERLAVNGGTGHPRVPLASARRAHDGAETLEVRHGLIFHRCLELHIKAAAEARGKQRERREGRALGTGAAQHVKGGWVEVLERRRMLEVCAGSYGCLDRLALGRKEATRRPNHRRSRHEGELELGDDTEGTVRTDDKVEGVHVVLNKVAGGVFGVRHLVGGEVRFDGRAALGLEHEMPAASADLVPAQRDHVAVCEHEPQRRHVAAHGAVTKAPCTRGVACGHTAQASRGLGGIGGEHLLRSLGKTLRGGKRRLVPTLGRKCLCCQVLSKFGKNETRLNAQVETPVLLAQAERAVHVREVEHMPALRHGARCKARARALHRDGRTRRAE